MIPRRELPVVVAICALAAAGIATWIGQRSLWYDEGVSLAFARLDWSTLWRAIHHVDAALAGYYALLHVWLVFGDSTVAVRSLSALAAVAAVALVYAIADVLFDRRTATIAALLFATSPFTIGFGSDARPYALVLAGSAASTLAFVRLARGGGPVAALVYALTALATVYLHVLALLFVLAHALSYPLLRSEARGRPPARSVRVVQPAPPRARGMPVLAAFGAIAVGSVPLLALLDAVGTAQIAWIPPPRPAALRDVLLEFAGSRPGAAGVLAALVVAVVIACRTPRGRVLAAVLTWAFLPVALTYALSLWQPLFIARYVADAFAPLMILVAAGIASLRPSALSAGAAVALAVFGLHAIWTEHAGSYEDYRAAARFTNAHARSSDRVIVYTPGSVYAFRAAEADVRGRLAAPIVYPVATWQYWNATPDDPGVPSAGAVARSGRVWLVMRDYAVHAAPFADWHRTIVGWLERRRYAPVARIDFTNVSVVCFERRTPHSGATQRRSVRP